MYENNVLIPRKVAEGKCSMAKRTLLTMPGSQQPVLLMEVDMTRSWATGLMHSLPLLMRSATGEIKTFINYVYGGGTGGQ